MNYRRRCRPKLAPAPTSHRRDDCEARVVLSGDSQFNPPHPGGILKDAIADYNMTVTAFAAHIGVAHATISRIVNEKAGITPAIAVRLGEAFRTSPALWFKMQTDRDFWVASQEKRKKIKQVTKIVA